MIVIPAIDMIDGKCVRLSQGKYESCKVYAEDPLDMAKSYQDAGFTRLHVVDLDGARSAKVVNLPALERICSKTSLIIDFGGGVKSNTDIESVFNAGATYACVGSVARTEPELTSEWLNKFGADKIIISADIWQGKVAIHGWKQVTDMTISDLLALYGGRVERMMCTDITKDGMLQGPSLDLYRDLLTQFPNVKTIASGGVSCIEDLRALAALGVAETVVGKAIYEGRVSLSELVELQNSTK